MRVWVVEVDCYENREVAGVYASLEAALAAHPVTRSERLHVGTFTSQMVPVGWAPDDPDNPDGRWSNGDDWGDAAHAYPMEVEG